MSFTLDIGNANTFQFVQNATGFIGERNGNNATVTLDSGILEVGGTFTIGNNSNGILNIQGGTWRQGRNTLTVGNGTGSGLLSISSGSLLTRADVSVGSTGIFQVLGTGPTQIGLGSHSSGDGGFTLSGLLDAVIDGGGITPIFVDDYLDDGGAFATFNAGSLLDLGFSGTPAAPGTWTLLELEGAAIDDQGLALAPGLEGSWSFAVDNSGANGLLTATYIPEPSTSLVLGLATLVGLGRRRRS